MDRARTCRGSAQWVAWRIGLPSILLLLLFGFVAGPLCGWVKPDELLGAWLMPLVSISVGLILFEGGLTLKFRELKLIGGVVRNLVTVGAVVTWLGLVVALAEEGNARAQELVPVANW